MTDTHSTQIDFDAVLGAELKFTQDAITSMQKTSDQLVVVAAGLLTGFLTVALKSSQADRWDLLTVLPAALAVVAAYTLRTNAAVNSIGGYRRAIEAEICTRAKVSNFMFETTIAPGLKRSPAYLATHVLITASVVVSTVIGLGAAHRASYDIAGPHREAGYFALVTLGYGALYLFLVFAYLVSLRSAARGHDATTAALKRPSRQPARS